MSASEEPFKAINSRGPADPNCFYRNGQLYVVVFPKEKEDLTLTQYEIDQCVARATAANQLIDAVIKAYKLNKAGEIKYSQLKESGQLPPPPSTAEISEQKSSSSKTSTQERERSTLKTE